VLPVQILLDRPLSIELSVSASSRLRLAGNSLYQHTLVGIVSILNSGIFMRAWHMIRREPLVHFAFLALLLFAGQALFGSNTREIISVDRATADFLIKQRSELLLRKLTQEETQASIDNFIEEEVLVREARKQGFANSSQIRRLMVQNMRFFIAGDIRQPSEQELRDFFTANIQRFKSPRSFDLDHVYFKGEPPADMVSKLNAGADHSKLGDLRDLRERRMLSIDQRRLVGLFGGKIAKKVMTIGDDRWHGPFQSPRGNHFIRITGRNEPELPTYESTSHWLETEWISAKSRELIDREVAKFKRNYQIIVEGTSDGGAQ